MSATERMQKLLATTNPHTLARIDSILDGTDNTPANAEQENRLCTYGETARRLNVSRMTVYRMAKAGRLEVVPLSGTNRITLRSINAFVNGGDR